MLFCHLVPTLSVRNITHKTRESLFSQKLLQETFSLKRKAILLFSLREIASASFALAKNVSCKTTQTIISNHP